MTLIETTLDTPPSAGDQGPTSRPLGPGPSLPPPVSRPVPVEGAGPTPAEPGWMAWMRRWSLLLGILGGGGLLGLLGAGFSLAQGVADAHWVTVAQAQAQAARQAARDQAQDEAFEAGRRQQELALHQVERRIDERFGVVDGQLKVLDERSRWILSTLVSIDRKLPGATAPTPPPELLTPLPLGPTTPTR